MQPMIIFVFVCGLVCLQSQAVSFVQRSRQERQALTGRTRSSNAQTWSNSEVKNYCDSVTWLGKRQRELCLAIPNIIPNTERGAAIGLSECRHQFRHQRWNCPIENSTAIFNSRVLQVKSAETAFLHAVMSAGVSYSVTRACGEGELEEVCGCDNKYRPTDDESKWNWDGCNDNVRYGNYFTTDFMGEVEGVDDGIKLMNSHNKEAGRQAIKDNMYTKCKCHGVSGSCSSKICWRTMAKFRVLGDVLMDKYFQAIRVKYARKKKRLRPHQKQIISSLPGDSSTPKKERRLPQEELVYLDPSPDWCERSKKYQSVGTHGRYCNKTSRHSDSCSRMCCGRGYQTMEKRVTESCNCRFHWCCVVTCETCTRNEELHVCN